MAKKSPISAGDILIADPFLPDPNFSRTVIFITEHSHEGSMGFVLNKNLEVLLSELIEVGPEVDLDIPIFNGGPVGNDTLHVLHQLGDHIPNSKRVGEDVYWGGDFEQIKYLLGNKNAQWKDFRFFLGYSGWGAGQLETELESSSWIVHKGNEDIIFNQTDNNVIWRKAMESKGGKARLQKDAPLNPDWN